MTPKTWEPFGLPDDTWDDVPDRDGVKVVNLSLGGTKDRSAGWLRNAMIGLGVLAAAAAAVSFGAQFRMVYAAKGTTWVAALEAAIPDAAALVFASLGIALALHGKRAIRARVLNVGAVATSVTMNLLAAEPGWRDLAIWVMPPVAYALASDTAIGVVRAWAIARQRADGEPLAEDESTPLAIITGLLLWTLRLVLAPPSTLTGFRRRVLEECPTAPGRRVAAPADVAVVPAALTPGTAAIPADQPAQSEPQPGPYRRPPRRESKTSRFLALVKEHHGELAGIDAAKVSRIAADLAPQVDLNPGSARSILLPLVRAAQNGHR